MVSRFLLGLLTMGLMLLAVQYTHLVFAGLLSLVLLALLVWVNLYPDKWLLHYLQAREIIENDHPMAYRSARAQAHKFKIQSLKIYSYSGFFHRTFTLAAGGRLTFVIEKQILKEATPEELEALFFTMALKADQKIASQHTLALLVTTLLWVLPLATLQRNKNRLSWTIQYFVAPLDGVLYRLLMPHFKWSAFLEKLAAYDWEKRRLEELNAKLEQPRLNESISRFFTYRMLASAHTPGQQIILAIEGAHHPFDLLRGAV